MSSTRVNTFRMKNKGIFCVILFLSTFFTQETMENILEAVIAGGGGEDDLEFVILDHILIDRDGIGEGPPFHLEELNDQEVLANFRFQREHLPLIKRCFNIPDEVRTPADDLVDGLKALCIVLKRLAYPCRLSDLRKFFRMSAQSLSQIINTTIRHMETEKGNLLENLQNLQWLNRNRMEAYAEVIHAKGAPIDNCWAFIDGTARAMCRPSIDQQEYYSGHKKFHCLKYQSVLCPDGIVASLMGAFPGRRHDAGIFRDSNLYAQLEQKSVFPEGNFVLYGDQGYGLMELLITPFPGAPENLTPQQLQFNQSMKLMRVAVEWGFSKTIANFAFVDFKKNQKLLLQDLESYYKVATLLSNAHTCLYGSQVAEYFNIAPPNWEEYFGL